MGLGLVGRFRMSDPSSLRMVLANMFCRSAVWREKGKKTSKEEFYVKTAGRERAKEGFLFMSLRSPGHTPYSVSVYVYGRGASGGDLFTHLFIRSFNRGMCEGTLRRKGRGGEAGQKAIWRCCSVQSNGWDVEEEGGER